MDNGWRQMIKWRPYDADNEVLIRLSFIAIGVGTGVCMIIYKVKN